jgi:hypothetical protein
VLEALFDAGLAKDMIHVTVKITVVGAYPQLLEAYSAADHIPSLDFTRREILSNVVRRLY